MQDEDKCKEQLMAELKALRQRLAELAIKEGVSTDTAVSKPDKQGLGSHRIEETLRRSEAILRQIIDLVPHRLFVKSWDGKYLLVNKAAAEAYNTSVSALTGKYHADFHPDESELQNMLRDDQEVMMKGETKFIPQEPHTDAQGNLRFMQTTKVPFRILGDKTPAVLGVSIDITGNKRAEEVLKQSEAKYRLISENTGDVIWQYDLGADRFVYVSPSAYRLTGFTPEEAMGHNMESVLTPASVQYVRKKLAEAIAGISAGDESVRVMTHELEQVRKDGSIVPIQVVTTPLQDAEGRVVGIIGVTRDITEQRYAAEALRESEAKFRTLFDTMLEGVALHQIVYDEHGRAVDYRIISTNPAFEKHTGLKSEQVLGQLAGEVYGLDEAPFLERYAQVANSGEPDSFETYLPKTNTFYHISATSPKRGYFITVFENITERKRAQEAQRESQACLTATIESIPSEFWALGPDGCYSMQNRICRKRFGNIIGKRPEEVCPNETILSIWQDNNRRAFAGKLVKGDVKYVLGNEERYFYNVVAPIQDAGRTLGIVGINVDISNCKRLEAALKKINEELESLVEKRTEELDAKTRRLEEFNAALRVLLKQREEDKAELEESILMNVKSLIVPYVEKLKKSRLSGDQVTYLSIIESHMLEITSPFTRRLSEKYLGFTPVEVQTADLIREGKTTQEIADVLCVSENTVSSNRFHIRKKLGLTNEKVSLRYYLQSFDK